MGVDGPIVVGILYPPEWYGDPEGFAAEVAAIEALDPRIEVVVERYDEPHDSAAPGASRMRKSAGT